VVNFTLRPLYPQGKSSSWYPLNRKLGGPQSRSGHGGRDKERNIRIKIIFGGNILIKYECALFTNMIACSSVSCFLICISYLALKGRIL
jgi:hypothetical protein